MAARDSLGSGHLADCLDDPAPEGQDPGMAPQGPGAPHQISHRNSRGFSGYWVIIIIWSGKKIAFP